MTKTFIQFPNAKVWRVGEDGVFQGILYDPSLLTLEGREMLAWLVCEAVHGAEVLDFNLTETGNLRFTALLDKAILEGCLSSEDGAFEGYQALEIDSDALRTSLQAQYDLSNKEVIHLLASIQDNPGASQAVPEALVPVVGRDRVICTPINGEPEYLRVTVDGYEIARWSASQWREDSSLVLAAIAQCTGPHRSRAAAKAL